MAEIVAEVTLGGRLTRYSVSGAVVLHEIQETIERFFQGAATNLVLWDFSAADVTALQSIDVHELAGLSEGFRRQRPSGRTALVFTSELGFGLGRMFESLRQSGEQMVQYRTFRDLREAEAWLAEAL